jgi:hypothetical protein
VSTTLTNCSNSSTLNNTTTLPPLIDINDVFDFHKFTEDNFIYPHLSSTEMTSGIFLSRILKEETVIPLLKDYVKEGELIHYHQDELIIPEESITDSHIVIHPRSDSIHYELNKSVTVYFHSIYTSLIKSIDDIPGLLLSYKSDVDFAAATKETVIKAIADSTLGNKIDVNQIDVTDKDGSN